MSLNLNFKLGDKILSSVFNQLQNPAHIRNCSGSQHVPDVLTRHRPQIRARQVSPTDFHDVIRIPSKAGPRDYLRVTFPRFLSDPRMVARVHYVDREFAALTAIQLLDNGQTAFWRNARVRAKFVEAGLFGDIMRGTLKNLQASHPKVQHHVFSTADDVAASILDIPVFKHNGAKEISKKKLISRNFNKKMIKTDPRSQKVPVHEVSQVDVMNMSYNAKLQERLFPTGTIIAHGKPLGLTEDNIPAVVNNVNAATFASSVSTKNKSIQLLASGRRLSNDQINNIDMLSFALHNETQAGMLYELDIQGPVDSVAALDAHIQYHVTRIKELAAGPGVVMVTVEDHVDGDLVAASLARHGVVEPTEGTDPHLRVYQLCHLDEFLHSGDRYDALTSQWKDAWGKRGSQGQGRLASARN